MGITSLLRVDLGLAGVWTNVTDHVYTEERVTIRRGRQSETATSTASAAVLAFNNKDGRFTPRNPSGAYYPNFQRNTPIRIGVGVPPQGSATGNVTAGTTLTAPATVAESAGLAIALWAQASPTATITVAAGYTASAAASGTYMTTRTGRLVVSGAGTVAAAAASSTVSAVSASAQVFIPGATTSGFGTISTTAAANAASEYNPPGVGPFVVATGDVLVACCAWSQDPRGGMVCPPGDDSTDCEWELVADSGVTSVGSPRVAVWTRYANKAAAALTVKFPNNLTGLADANLAVYQLTGATAWNPRFHGVCSDISSDTVSGHVVRATVTCGSALRTLGQGLPPAHSSMWRSMVRNGALAYWPMEGGTLSQAVLSPVPGVAPATVFGPFAAGSSTGAYPFSDALGTFSTPSNVVGQVPAYSTAANVAGGMVCAFQLSASDGALQGKAAIMLAQMSGAAGKPHYAYLEYTTDTSMTFKVLDETQAVLVSSALTIPSVLAPVNQFFFVFWSPNLAAPATTFDWQMGTIRADTGLVTLSNQFSTATVMGPVSNVWIGREPTGGSNFSKAYVGGHLTFTSNCVAQAGYFTSDAFPNSVTYSAMDGWLGENRHERMLRLCQENGVGISLPSTTVTAQFGSAPGAMGAQLSDTVPNLLGICQATDTGELFDARTSYALCYRPVAALSGHATVATLNYAGGQIAAPLVPVDDDAVTRNDVTVVQQSGASARSVVTTGALGTLTVGGYATSVTADVYVQARDLPNIASWLTHVGTVNEQRFTAVRVPLEASGAVQAISAIDIGQRVTISNTPVWMQPGPTEGIVIGVTEVLGPLTEWAIVFALEPYSPYAVLRLDGGTGLAELDSHYLGLNGV